MRGIRTLIRELWWYLTYDDYGRRRLRPAAYALLLPLGLAAAVFLWAFFQSRQALPAERPAPTLPPPTATAVFATVTAAASRPTATPAPLCPEDPLLWRLVEIRLDLRDPKTGKPIQLPKPIYRIDPPCVYQGLWRDLADALFATYTRADVPPKIDKEVEVPWYWDPGPEITRKTISIYLAWMEYLFYDRAGRKIDEVLTPYTALSTGDPDYPVLVYLYRDYPGAAYGVQWEGTIENVFGGRVTEIRPVRLEGGTVLRRVEPVLYHAGVHRWFLAGGKGLTRRIHVVDADGLGLWEVLGVRGTTRSALGRTFGKKDFFPDQVDLKAYPMQKTLTFTP
ncbi:hypothetical protein [Thermoflexus sp.]|uniref:hypothetical protein n=1 Tax=Thermoflexus sp. TaxID=1969742 RepID=UPI002ADE3FA3|nr:hypothetical protein [Thermoflexus sp.]